MFWNFASRPKAAKFKIYALFLGAVKFHAKILLAKLQNSCVKFCFKILSAKF
ncbi:hypothetical protein CAMGR0001_1615 [Campylobacter gracilis RM3268]|uniref:Uncharacterized protein n=1 Tax=Campylobacter gracilis RM3268 TaxID=553220 RepID=C8PIF4_9BACT|nr:hypothetical protein CAMGR0001_1615 [Campylobacter gracilis RM3268]